jgi:SulP family sulfate permease
MESIAVAKAFAQRQGYEVNANQELIGLGMANLGGSVFQAYPVTGGFSRTAVNAEAGARTGLASLITAAVVALTLVFLTPLFHYLPKAVLAAVIMTAVFGLVDLRAVKHLWRVKRSDLALMLTTFLATLLVGIEQGILIGVGASLLWFVVRTTRPHFAVLGRLPDTRIYRNLERHPRAETVSGVLVVRMDAQFYFGNMSFLRDTLRRLERQQVAPLRAVVIDGSSINNLDSSADVALHEVHADYAGRGILLYLTGVKGPVLDVLRRSGLFDKLGADHFFLDVADAVEALESREPPHRLAHGGTPGGSPPWGAASRASGRRQRQSQEVMSWPDTGFRIPGRTTPRRRSTSCAAAWTSSSSAWERERRGVPARSRR